MNKADKIYNSIVLDIANNGVSDSHLPVRGHYADGEPAHTKSIFARQYEFEQGEIPLISTKKVFAKTAEKRCVYFGLTKPSKKKTLKPKT